jgi:hypothetical protein
VSFDGTFAQKQSLGDRPIAMTFQQQLQLMKK